MGKGSKGRLGYLEDFHKFLVMLYTPFSFISASTCTHLFVLGLQVAWSNPVGQLQESKSSSVYCLI